MSMWTSDRVRPMLHSWYRDREWLLRCSIIGISEPPNLMKLSVMRKNAERFQSTDLQIKIRDVQPIRLVRNGPSSENKHASMSPPQHQPCVSTNRPIPAVSISRARHTGNWNEYEVQQCSAASRGACHIHRRRVWSFVVATPPSAILQYFRAT